MPTIKKIKGGLISIKDATVAETTLLEVEVTIDQIQNAASQNIYLELDLTTAQEVNIILPAISSLKGQLGFCIWVNDKGATTGTAALVITCAGSDTSSGQTSIKLASKGAGILLSPVGESSWGTFYTQNVTTKFSEIAADERIPGIKAVAP